MAGALRKIKQYVVHGCKSTILSAQSEVPIYQQLSNLYLLHISNKWIIEYDLKFWPLWLAMCGVLILLWHNQWILLTKFGGHQQTKIPVLCVNTCWTRNVCNTILAIPLYQPPSPSDVIMWQKIKLLSEVQNCIAYSIHVAYWGIIVTHASEGQYLRDYYCDLVSKTWAETG